MSNMPSNFSQTSLLTFTGLLRVGVDAIRVAGVSAVLIAGVLVGGSAAGAAQQAAAGGAPPVAYTSVNELKGILAQLQTTTQSIQGDLQAMRVEKWKTDGATKKQALADSDSIRRNLQSTLPDTITQLNNSPEDIGVSFKLYRNIDALYDVFGSVAELAGAFGSKDEAQSLGNDLNELQNARHAFGERVQKLAGAKEDELGRLRSQVKTLSAAPPPPPKKVVVDDTEPPAKKPAKKKATKPGTTTPPATSAPKPSPGDLGGAAGNRGGAFRAGR
jgi:hypothetical protein